jgi:hypothetical protein
MATTPPYIADMIMATIPRVVKLTRTVTYYEYTDVVAPKSRRDAVRQADLGHRRVVRAKATKWKIMP